MPLIRPSLATIISRVEGDITSRLTGNKPLLSRAFLKVLARVFAVCMHILYGLLETIAKQLFVTTSEGEFLDRYALMFSITRQAATLAIGNIRFTGTNTTVVPIGTLVKNSSGIEYKTTAAGTISGNEVIVAGICTTAGIAGNIDINTALSIVSPIAGVDTEATANTAFVGGLDLESDEDLRTRVLLKVQNQSSGGNVKDYERWALEISGVKNVWVYPLYNGAGTVYVAIAAEGADPVASGALITSVQNYLNTKKPVTAIVTVVTVTKILVDIVIDIDPFNNELSQKVKDNITALFVKEGRPGQDFLLTHINNAIFDAGVNNHTITSWTFNGSSRAVADVDLNAFEFLVADDLTVS